MLLELSHYLGINGPCAHLLESYLWPNFGEESSKEHLLSMLIMVNEKFRENVSAWACFHKDEDKFPLFFARALGLQEQDLSLVQRRILVTFLVNVFQSLEDKMVRERCLKYDCPLTHLSD